MATALTEEPVQTIYPPVQRFTIGQTVYAVSKDRETNEIVKDVGIVVGIVFVWSDTQEALDGVSHLEQGFSYVLRSADPDQSWTDTFPDNLLVAEEEI